MYEIQDFIVPMNIKKESNASELCLEFFDGSFGRNYTSRRASLY